MARGVGTPVAADPLPKVSFVKIQDEGTANPPGAHDLQMRSYGYNEFADFRRPEHYIRHIEPLESELAIQVEYDMDEQDKEWLDIINTERKKEQLGTVPYEMFEIIIDRLEKEWFDLTKNIPKPDMSLPSEDSTCAICDDAEGENSNAIVFCDGCNLAVHQDCYGVPYIPEGQWLCRKCTVSPEIPVSCILCPQEGGAFKQTTSGDWIHLLCAIWVPETGVANEVFMEPITGIELISKQRWKLKCSVCEIREGACIQCANKSCFVAFHPTCARKEKLLMSMKSTHGSDPAPLTAFCEKHLPKEQYDARVAMLAARGDEVGEANPKLSKSARAYAKTYKPGPPLVPWVVVDRIMKYIHKMSIRKKIEFLILVCKYWSLKREARRGAPLLKRLHLEPWTASAGSKQQTDEEKAMKLEHMKRLRDDLQSVRALAELTRKRESRKLSQAETIHEVVSHAMFPHEPPLRMAFEKIVAMDRNDFFKNPVSRIEVPDYLDIIKRPMCWNIIDEKLDRHQYWDIQAFKDDIGLVVDNAMLYNKPGDQIYKAALKIQGSAKPILDDLGHLATLHPLHHAVNDLNPSSSNLPQAPSDIGDLEPSLGILELLVSEDAIKDDIQLLLTAQPMISLFDYEFGKLKPPPPPPPPKPWKPKRDRKAEKAERERLRKEKAAAAAGTANASVNLDNSPGFRASAAAPRTRRAAAAAAAFEAEAHADTGGNASSKRGRRKRVSVGQGELPPVIETVEKRDMFKHFEEGFMLPENTKRGGRVARELPPLPPSKKRRVDKGPSRLSMVSTAASENLTLRESASRPEQLNIRDDTYMDVDVPGPTTGNTSQDTSAEHTSIIYNPDGTVIIEELDTPAARRSKNLRKKAERQQQAAPKVLPPTVNEPPVAGPSRLPADDRDENDGESDLSSLSSMDSDGEEVEDSTPEAPPPAPPVRAPEPSGPPPGSTAAILATGTEQLTPGTLVWAKVSGYPWFPGVVFDETTEGIPRRTLNDKPQGSLGALHLVNFYDHGRSWVWAQNEQLLPLGEDEALDQDLIANNSKRQKWKNSKAKTDCRAAYRLAMTPEESVEGSQEENTGQSVDTEGDAVAAVDDMTMATEP
ncbi:hypothetical protein PLICRDRAFT_44511 [Plicaturopsis crispa FD-325 SS-3]|nr:hypothetical protein PLICRDRAFT_44511 [Plicaturopsis crispa FD-325 SS-3]